MTTLSRLVEFVQLKVRESATRDALEALSERQLADLGLVGTDIARLARLAAAPSSAGLTIAELATMVRETSDAGVGSLTLLLSRLLGAAGEARDTAAERRGAAPVAEQGRVGAA